LIIYALDYTAVVALSGLVTLMNYEAVKVEDLKILHMHMRCRLRDIILSGFIIVSFCTNFTFELRFMHACVVQGRETLCHSVYGLTGELL
jgi:hypothetical protein